ncbi:Ribose-phosphate diphosphokinase [Carpediemonas membranifera]|uniref:ribose-phosphate diphosphokinase n=1 Tax=Carpediemonas membranifera TaxID=201153 RepID=A0A8J6B2N7_9EUKA|nr:Ribose-phosphate diphosphokinase [Carpediemonas membranifera]|eukprot:KAG9397095.1 Ribose-phosphate diphosphokinase [Carpediemonas membranifera]
MPTPVLFSSEKSAYLVDLIAQHLSCNCRHGSIIRRQFSDGEQYYRIDMKSCHDSSSKTTCGSPLSKIDDLEDRVTIYVSALVDDRDFLELFRVGCTMSSLGAKKRIFVIPFLGYSTMERAVKPGECVTAKENARMLSAIPSTGSGNIFLLLDLHVSGILHYFEGPCLRLEMYAESILVEGIKALNLDSEIVDGRETRFMFASADLGRAKWVETFAQMFHTDLAFISKKRNFEHTEVHAVIGDVDGRAVIIYDDMTRSGGTLMNAATAYLERGASKIYSVLSHFALCSETVIDELLASQITTLITTNSHPMSQHPLVKDHPDRFVVMDVSKVFVDRIRWSLDG